MGVGFLGAVGRTGRYTLKTIWNIFYFSLLRLHKRYIHEKIPSDVRLKMIDKIANLKIERVTKTPRGGMEPLINDDVHWMVHQMDVKEPRRLMLASLFLFAEYTGCRG